MRKSLRFVTLAAALAAVLIIAACATNPVTGRREFVLMTESQEISLGAEVDREIVATYGLYPDLRLQAYVNGIGKELAMLSHRPHLLWHFRVLDTPVVNAFAVPGGYIYITRGLLAHLNSEAELAMILGHEIGHVTARHTVRQYTRQILIMGGIAIGAAVSERFRRYAPLAMIGAQVLFLKFSRDQERQADDLGVIYAYSGGYDPGRFHHFFETLSRIREVRGGGGLPGFLSTHPTTPHRIQDVQAEAQRVMAKQPPTGSLAVRRDEYLLHLDGLVYGENPRQGYAERGFFFHPDLRFSFAYPSNWELVNTTAMVQMKPQSENAIINLTLQQTGSSPQAVFNQQVSENDLVFVSGGRRNINGHDAYVGVCDYDDDSDNVLRLMVCCIRKDANVYTFVGASELANFNSYSRHFNNTFYSFRHLSDANALNRQPTRLSVGQVGRSDTVERYIVQNGIPSEFREDVLIINAAQRSDRLLPRSLFKLIR